MHHMNRNRPLCWVAKCPWHRSDNSEADRFPQCDCCFVGRDNRVELHSPVPAPACLIKHEGGELSSHTPAPDSSVDHPSCVGYVITEAGLVRFQVRGCDHNSIGFGYIGDQSGVGVSHPDAPCLGLRGARKVGYVSPSSNVARMIRQTDGQSESVAALNDSGPLAVMGRSLAKMVDHSLCDVVKSIDLFGGQQVDHVLSDTDHVSRSGGRKRL